MPDKNHSLFSDMESLLPRQAEKQSRPVKKPNGYEPPNLGKAIRLTVPDFNDPNRSPACLEVDFPIAPINALSSLEGNAGKPIYQMSKWWARRRSSVFRSLLIAAATEVPPDPTQAAKRVWDHYYCNHQKAGTFRKLRVLDIFMGGGTTLVEGTRLGFQMAGVDLNPVAWFVTKNELACSDPEQVTALFEHIEAEVKPLVQPFYTTICPRGHQGRWIDVQTDSPVNVDPLDLPPDERRRYRWEGPEVIYTFWAKHGPCQAKGCGHRTPVFRSPVVAEKKLSTTYIPTICPSCGQSFDVELGETRMAPGVERVLLGTEPSLTETSQRFAQLLSDYSKGDAQEKHERVIELLCIVDGEPGLRCPTCQAFAGGRIKSLLERQSRARRVSDLKKKDFGIEKKPVYMSLLIHPEWLEGGPGLEGENESGGYAGAPPEDTIAWYEHRLKGLRLIEVRGLIKLADENAAVVEDEITSDEDAGEPQGDEAEVAHDRKKYGLPREIVLKDGTRIQTRVGTVPEQSHFTCRACGRQQDLLEAVKPTGHTAPVAPYALQCHCLQCQEEGYNYGGRYFKAPDPYDMNRMSRAECEWAERAEGDLSEYWPRSILPYAWKTSHWDIQGHGYTHWWKMFNPRQLLVHTQLLQAITNAPEGRWPLDVREQALGAFQQYLRNQNMFAFYHVKRDCLAPALSNANFHPKQAIIEVSAYSAGYGPWGTTSAGVLVGLVWARRPWDSVILLSSEKRKSVRAEMEDPVQPGWAEMFCGSSTDLSMCGDKPFDLVITDPPFGDNVNYADLADFFYVWVRIPLLLWYKGLPEWKYFSGEFSPKTIEAVINKAEHPDDREEWEKEHLITTEILDKVCQLTGSSELNEKDLNPLYRPEPASEFYQQTLTACWARSGATAQAGRPDGLHVPPQ